MGKRYLLRTLCNVWRTTSCHDTLQLWDSLQTPHEIWETLLYSVGYHLPFRKFWFINLHIPQQVVLQVESSVDGNTIKHCDCILEKVTIPMINTAILLFNNSIWETSQIFVWACIHNGNSMLFSFLNMSVN